MRAVRIAVAAASLLLGGAVFADSVTCPIDNMSMWFTGKTRVDMGKLLQEYRCPNGHLAWVIQ